MNSSSLVIIAVVVFFASAILAGLLDRKNKKTPIDTDYQKKDFLSPPEKHFLQIIKPLEELDFIIIPQVNLATIIQKNSSSHYQTELFRNIDFAIFDKDYNIKLLIELNDSTHNQPYRKSRDIKVKNITENASIPLITFYTNMPNKPNYVLDRIKNKLKENK
ncbi:MAG: DUF2726 domain-containing protein [Candidatus Nomurabacteria bacterium]|jgi:hypothetical protein|nr:DUF2726 domain-containing protein [Candidatus Nomurabacteria bacterium]